MKFALATLLSTAIAVNGTNTCVTDFDAAENVDYYPTKVDFDYASSLSITYHGNYKKLGFTDWSGTYTTCVVKCGTTLPSSATGCDTTVTPETNKMAISAASQIPYIHSLGMIDSISLAMIGTSSIQNSCVLDAVTDGTLSAVDADGNGYDWSSTMDTGHVDDVIEFTLTPGYGNADAVKNSVPFVEWSDPSLLGRTEWILYLGALTDQEFFAQNVYDEQKSRIDCVTNNVETLREAAVVDGTDVTVLWATRSDYIDTYSDPPVSHEGWDVATCTVNADAYGGYGPYYCEAANLLGVQLLNTTAGSVVAGSSVYMTDDEFESYGADADRGMNDFFETFVNQADTFIEDMASIAVDGQFLDGDNTAHVRVFYRNIFTEPTGSFGICPGATLALLSDQCSPINEVFTLGSPGAVASLKIAAAAVAFFGGAFLAF
ncbi:hypothetical protein TL16_g02643 [Triparma laevis f. inornata]|uniref:Uncharacterized protein n=1 Tax=Triparma laevis f. inornata TaxID=1714386 RepID=A0A9W6ZY48_9STRA|nr:hypothetical protein TL16_g02643 [Triparma laevis f. inornata]